MIIKCNRCGKEINKGEAIMVSQSDVFNGDEESYWCRNCFESFIKEVETSERAFKGVKPAIKQNFEENINKFIKANEKND